MNTLRILRTGAAAVVLSLCAAAASAQTYSKQQLQDLYSSFVTAEGFRPEITPAGNVKFKREGRTHLIYADEKDPTYFRLTMAFAQDDKSPQARLRRLEGCNVATAEVKVIKCFLDSDGDPNFSAEMFLIVPGDFKMTLNRLLRAMDNAYEKYTARFNQGS